MERRPRSRAQLATALLTAAFWAGCAWGPAPVDHFYALEPGAPSARAAKPLSGTLQVDRLRSSAMVGERNVLYRKDGNASEINRYSYHRWSDPPTILLQTELVAHLKAAGAADTVMAATARVKADYVVSGRLISKIEEAQLSVLRLIGFRNEGVEKILLSGLMRYLLTSIPLMPRHLTSELTHISSLKAHQVNFITIGW